MTSVGPRVGGVASSKHLVPRTAAAGDDRVATARLAVDIAIDGLLARPAGIRP